MDLRPLEEGGLYLSSFRASLMLSLVCSFETANLVEEILIQLKGVRVASSLGARIVQVEIRVVGSILSATDMNTLDHQFSVLRPDQDW